MHENERLSHIGVIPRRKRVENSVIFRLFLKIRLSGQALYNNLNGEHLVGFSETEVASITGTDKDFETLCNKLQDTICIREIAAFGNFAHAEIIDSSWLHFRFAQAFALLLLVQKRRYPNAGDMRSNENLTHEILDQEYLILGLQLGSLATKEIRKKRRFSSLAWKYHTLAPDHLLITE
jgi:hypothetical protein